FVFSANNMSLNTVILPSDMNALLLRFHNFFFPLWQGEDRVCKCFCGSQQAYRVVPYEGAMSTVDSRENFFGSDIMTQQNMDVIVGLCSGILITWLLMWLNRVWKSARSLFCQMVKLPILLGKKPPAPVNSWAALHELHV
uniref:Transmembrane protein 240b n=1 Tax=Amphiprion ocellaris TaxID=80972 RepID=A0AAQ5X9I9_AMPOC